jgi:two-component system OmpR family sensor kinase/two-component system sensor histidine kinase BaeS
MRGRDFRRAPPRWWPANEAWPPAGRRHAWRHGRTRFVRRLAFLFAALLLLSATGAATLISRLLGGSGIAATVPLGPLAIMAFLWLLALLATGMRRVAVPLGDIVEAANRVAGGDYSARIREHGPPSVRVVANAFNTMAGRLEAQDRQRRNLMADIAHELRTPLSVIQGRIEGLLDGVYRRDDETLAEVMNETRLLARLVEDLRTLANAESGTLTLKKEPTDLAMLAQDVMSSVAIDAERGRISLRLDTAPDLPSVSVDPLRIREVLANLMANALHHTPPGGAVSGRITTAGREAVVSVADTGSGVAPEELSKIFDRFYKGEGSRGSGIGLTIARNLIVAHGGTIRADSTPGKGTTLTLTLPIA